MKVDNFVQMINIYTLTQASFYFYNFKWAIDKIKILTIFSLFHPPPQTNMIDQ